MRNRLDYLKRVMIEKKIDSLLVVISIFPKDCHMSWAGTRKIK